MSQASRGVTVQREMLSRDYEAWSFVKTSSLELSQVYDKAQGAIYTCCLGGALSSAAAPLRAYRHFEEYPEFTTLPIDWVTWEGEWVPWSGLLVSWEVPGVVRALSGTPLAGGSGHLVITASGDRPVSLLQTPRQSTAIWDQLDLFPI